MTFLQAVQAMLEDKLTLNSKVTLPMRKQLFKSIANCLDSTLDEQLSDDKQFLEESLDDVSMQIKVLEGKIEESKIKVNNLRAMMDPFDENDLYESKYMEKAAEIEKEVKNQAITGTMLNEKKKEQDSMLDELNKISIMTKYPKSMSIVTNKLAENSEPFEENIDMDTCKKAIDMLKSIAALNIKEDSALIQPAQINSNRSQVYSAISALHRLIKNDIKISSENKDMIDNYMKQFPDKLKDTPLHEEIRYVNEVLSAGLSPISLGEIVGKPLSGMVKRLLDYRSKRSLVLGLSYRDIQDMLGDRRNTLDVLIDTQEDEIIKFKPKPKVSSSVDDDSFENLATDSV